jgi:hypothetical protein
MHEALSAVVALTRCSQYRFGLFGVRYATAADGVWAANWSFPIEESALTQGGSTTCAIVGSFVLAEDYPGCPFCGATGLSQCSCGQAACWDGKRLRVTCPWCRESIDLAGYARTLRARVDL